MIRSIWNVIGSVAMGGLVGCALIYILVSPALAWFLAFCWATGRAVQHQRSAERWQNAHARAVGMAREGRNHEIRVKLDRLTARDDDTRSRRINEKLRDQNVSQQKIIVDLQDEVRKRDKIIAGMRESQKPKRERTKVNG